MNINEIEVIMAGNANEDQAPAAQSASPSRDNAAAPNNSASQSSMSTSDERPEIPPRLLMRMQELHQNVCLRPIAERIWEEILDDQQRAAVDSNPNPTADICRAYARVTGATLERAVLDLAYRVGLVHPGEYQTLGEALGVIRVISGNVPDWDKSASVLRFQGRVIKTLHRPRRSANAVRILDAFQEENWPARIDDPLPGGPNPKRLRGVVCFLNTGIESIEFQADGTGEGVRWAFLPSAAVR